MLSFNNLMANILNKQLSVSLLLENNLSVFIYFKAFYTSLPDVQSNMRGTVNRVEVRVINKRCAFLGIFHVASNLAHGSLLVMIQAIKHQSKNIH